MDFDFTTETITPDASTVLTIGGVGALELPSGTTGQEPAGILAGAIRWNTTVPQLEYYNGTVWLSFGGSVTSVQASGGTTGLTFSGGPITTSGTLTLSGTLAPANGGTGATAVPTNGQILIGNGTTYTVASVTTGTGISTTVGAGTLQINNTGVTSAVAGTGISVSGATGAVTIGNTGVLTFSAGTTGLTPNTATAGAVTLAGTLIVGNGGTGATSFTANGVVLGNGTSPLAITAVGATGTVLAGNTGAAPTFQSAPAISGANFTATTIPNSALVNSAVTIGATSVALGGTATALTGMTGITFSSGTVTGVANPVAGTDVVNLNYLQTVLAGLEWKQEAVAASTTNLTVTYANGASGVGATLTNAGAQAVFAIDGFTPNAGDRILIKNQTTQTQNGIYTVTNVGSGSTNWVLTRSFDNNTPAGMDNATLFVTNGTANQNTAWTQTTANPTIGTNNIVFVQNSGSGTYSAGTGLTLTGNVFSLTSPVSPTLGGTGTTTAPSAGQILIGTSGSVYTPATLTQGTGITLTSASGSITVANAGVLTFSGGTTGLTPNTATSGAITLAGTLVVGNGGTGATTLTAHGVLLGQGTSAVTATAVGATGTVLHGNTGADPTFSAVSLTADVTGVLPLANGGTNANLTASAGSVAYSTAGALALTAVGTTGFFLTSAGAGTPTWSNPATTVVQSFSAGTTGLTPSSATTGAVTLAGTLAVANGGTGLTTAPTNGQIDIGSTGVGFVRTTITGTASQIGVTNGAGSITLTNLGVLSNIAGTGIGVSGATGNVTISNTGVTSITGTANQITASASTGAVTLSLPSTLIAPGSIASTTTITAATGLTLTFATANAFLYSGTAGAVTSTAQATNGSLLIGSTGAAPVLATLTAGTNVYVTNGAGSITIAASKYWAESSTAPSTLPSATGNQSMAVGNSAVASRYGQLAQASGSFGTAGDAQTSVYVLRNSTANATPAVLFMDGSAARLTLPVNSAWMFEINIVARRTDATGTSGAWQLRGLIIQDATAGTTALVGTQSRTFLAGAGLVASSVSATADTTNGALQINVTGNAAQTIRWVATARITEVANV